MFINPIPVNFPSLITNLDAKTIPFDTRFVRNLIDDDITLPSGFLSEFDGTTASLNGRTLTISGLQFGDSIQFAAGSGFAVGYPNTTLNGSAIATTTGNASTFTLTFTTDFTAAQLEQLLEALTFQAGASNPPATSRSLTFSVNTPTQLTGTVAITLSAPTAQNLIQDLDNQTVAFSATSVRLDSAITLTDEFIDAYSTQSSLSNARLVITGWTGSELQIGAAPDSGVQFTPNQYVSFLKDVLVNGTLIGNINLFSGELGFTPFATAALVEQFIEGVTINPQLSAETPNRTITVTITTPTFPQVGSVTFTGAPLVLSDLRESVDVSFNTAMSFGLLLDDDVTLSGDGPWNTGTIEVTGMVEGDKIYFYPDTSTTNPTVFFNLETGEFQALDPNFIPVTIGYMSPNGGEALYSITLTGHATLALVEAIIEGLRLETQTQGPRTLEIKVTNGSGFVAKDTITVNVGYIPTLTDLSATLDLTTTEAANGQFLDTNVTFKADSILADGGMMVSGWLQGETVRLFTGDGSPFSREVTEKGTLIYYDDGTGEKIVATLYSYEDNIQFVFNRNTNAAIVEAIIENLVFRSTMPTPSTTRNLTILITDQDGEFDTDVITVNIVTEGAKQLSYQILQDVNGTLVPVENGTGTTGDFNPSDLFGPATAPDSFVVQYSGLLDAGLSTLEERSVITFDNVAPGTVLVVNGVSYPLEGPKGRLILDLAPGLHKITLQVPYEAQAGQIVTTPPTLTIGNVVPPDENGFWPDYNQTPLFDTVRTAPDTLYRLDVVSNVEITGISSTEVSHTVYLTENSPGAIEAALQAIRAKISPPPQASFTQSFSTTAEKTGGVGSEVITGEDGNDALFGGAGDDTLVGGLGADTLDGGTGDNTVSYAASDRRVIVDLSKGIGKGGHAEGDVLRNIQNVIGSTGHDNIIGSADANQLFGGRGRDTLRGGGGDDLLNGGGQNDMLDGGTGHDTLIGGAGDDVLYGMSGNDQLFGGSGNDTLYGGDGDDLFLADAGADAYYGGTGNNEVSYGRSRQGVTVDLTAGTGSGGLAEGDTFHDINIVTGSAHADSLSGSTAADTLTGKAGDDSLSGQDGNDVLTGGSGNDALFGGDGNDLLLGGAGADTLDGGAGIDTVSYKGSKSGVTVSLAGGFGQGGDATGDTYHSIERVIGSSHNDRLLGSDANETISGGQGNDTIDAGRGNDRLTGGAGADMFIFNPGHGIDRITDFSAEDSIALGEDLWGTVEFGDAAALVETYGHQVGSYVELRFSPTDIIRIDNMTLETLAGSSIYLYD